jgi:hypothetical protein
MATVVQPCLLCDAPVDIPVEDWMTTEAPIALCDGCVDLVDNGTIPWPLVKMTYVMRCQIAKLFEKTKLIEDQLKRLFRAQQDLEQESLTRGKRAA